MIQDKVAFSHHFVKGLSIRRSSFAFLSERQKEATDLGLLFSGQYADVIGSVSDTLSIDQLIFNQI